MACINFHPLLRVVPGLGLLTPSFHLGSSQVVAQKAVGSCCVGDDLLSL